MSVLIDGFAAGGRRILFVAALIPALVAPAAAQNRNSASSVTIAIDQAQIMKLPDTVATLVVGNPLIADVSVQSGGMAVLTGKGFGVTNLLVLNHAGEVLEQKTIQVQGVHDSVVVYRGIERESYSCTPKCERRITLGDSTDYFAKAIEQTQSRTGSGVQSK